ncbi:MAG: hypothetical protein ACO3EZ_15495 [Prochlorotrichaceae cyanobacterium]
MGYLLSSQGHSTSGLQEYGWLKTPSNLFTDDDRCAEKVSLPTAPMAALQQRLH